MDADSQTTVTPPPGFNLDTPINIVKPPNGYQLDTPQGPKTPSRPLSDFSGVPGAAVSFARPFVDDAAAGAAGLAALPADPATLGLASVGAGATGYTLADALMQHLHKLVTPGEDTIPNSMLANTIGLKPGSVAATLANIGQQKAEMWGLGKLTGALTSGVKVLRDADNPEIYRLSPTTGQAAKNAASEVPQPGVTTNIPQDVSNWWTRAKLNALGTGSRTIEGFNQKATAQALDKSAISGTTAALDLTNKLGFDLTKDPFTGHFQPSWAPRAAISAAMPFGDTLTSPGLVSAARSGDNYEQAIGKVYKLIDNPTQLSDYMGAAQRQGVDYNVRRSLQQAQFSRIWTNAVSTSDEGLTKIDPSKLQDAWNNTNFTRTVKEGQTSSKNQLFNAQDRADIDQFFKRIGAVQDKAPTFAVSKPLMIARGGLELGSGIVSGLLTGSVENGVAGGVGATSVILGGDAIARALTNRKTARFLVNLAGGEAAGASDQYVARVLAQALNGSTVAIQDVKGGMHPAKFQNGRLVPLQ